ncbi:class I SAM-dependent DNA methyltransferase [Brevundimonas vesicularis]|uniref:Nodulation S family protein n=1 Tax=Brevundimonas vesicularis TaxID=41276 RepID=A0ABU4KN31_BREVE|nr:SAM-dependent methyltransferase [Brevundimonas vesicularis]MDX2334339.1 nodulation S family protein [Brevundimonas vesicularis]
MAERSLPAAYFEGIFAGDADPWDLASSPYETAKFDRTIAALSTRRAAVALEVGCAGGVLTERLSAVCDRLLAIDVSPTALERARQSLSGRRKVRFAAAAFPRECPVLDGLDLVVLSEVAYYWSDADLDLAAQRIADGLVDGGRVLLVHWTGETDYPQTADDAVERLWLGLSNLMQVELAERHPNYRLDMWSRR